jgi:hypothetical protein
MWRYLSGESQSSPREHFLVLADVIVRGRWKYVKGNTTMIEAAWGGEVYPNASTASDPIDGHTIKCPSRGCLFDVVADVREAHEVSADNPKIVDEMRTLMGLEAASMWSQPHKNDPECAAAATARYGNFYGPWREVA